MVGPRRLTTGVGPLMRGSQCQVSILRNSLKEQCRPVIFKKWSCRPVEFKKWSCPMLLSFKNAVSILGVKGHWSYNGQQW